MIRGRTLGVLALVIVCWLLLPVPPITSRQDQVTYIHLTFAALCITVLNGFMIYIIGWTFVHVLVLWTWITIGYGLQITLTTSMLLFVLLESLRQCIG